MPAIIAVLTIQIGKMIVIQVLRKDAVVDFLSRIITVLSSTKSLFSIAAARNNKTSVSARGAFCDDVNDSVNRISSPDCPARTADYLNAVDVLQRHVQRVPVNSPEKWTVHSSAVD